MSTSKKKNTQNTIVHESMTNYETGVEHYLVDSIFRSPNNDLYFII